MMVEAHTACHPRCQRQSGDISKCMLSYPIERNVKESQCLVLWFPLLVDIKPAPSSAVQRLFSADFGSDDTSLIFSSNLLSSVIT